MGLRLALVFLLVALTATMASSSSDNALSGYKNNSTTTGHYSHGMATCNGQIGDCIDETEEMMLDSEASRRVLATRARSLSYEFLSRDKVPCSRRGASYYNCRKAGRANPYRRGCTVATRCARRTS